MGRALAKPITLLNHAMGIAALHPSYGLLRKLDRLDPSYKN
jgi:hypothetical protein